jgi:hypothetical protein
MKHALWQRMYSVFIGKDQVWFCPREDRLFCLCPCGAAPQTEQHALLECAHTQPARNAISRALPGSVTELFQMPLEIVAKLCHDVLEMCP